MPWYGKTLKLVKISTEYLGTSKLKAVDETTMTHIYEIEIDLGTGFECKRKRLFINPSSVHTIKLPGVTSKAE